MEISSFPFLTFEDNSLFYSLSQELDIADPMINPNKRRRTDGSGARDGGGSDDDESEGFNKSIETSFKEILTSMMSSDEGQNQEQEDWWFSSEQEKDMLEANPTQESNTMKQYHEWLPQIFPGIQLPSESKNKRARLASNAPNSTRAAVASGDDQNPDNLVQKGNSNQSGGNGSVHHKRLWVKDRSKDWWERCSHSDYPEEEFKRDFRMSRATFDMICDELDSVITKKDTMLRAAIPVRQRVAVCIWRLATGEPLRLISKRFGLGISTCHKLVLEVCSAIKTVLMPKFLLWPDEGRLRRIKKGFESLCGIQNVGGSIYTTHVPIIAPKISGAAYFNKRHTERNQKTSYSITVQGVVDDKGVFNDICIGWPGSMPDDQVLGKSALYQRASGGQLKDVWIVGNSSYSLSDWVLVPFSRPNLTWTQHAFNEKIGEVQSVAKRAFARLKGRWSCLQKRTEVKLQDLPVVLGACCVLHNICEIRNEKMDPQLTFELFDDEVLPENSFGSASSVQARDHIAHYLLHHGLAGTTFL
ncbi:hypothetical protein Nepgr_005934 [Nepenthes gracilis]|uniref:DDE Tnp4 domain-containing protein n=1 Tax=Nepenthes gracilis TaxID=150966 RepID=A0AAD3XGX2_NEPGR|nr:hypothetical protein Nepgr_005934 [Nepenthes gracilis]